MPCLAANVGVRVVLHQAETQPLNGLPVLEATEIREECICVLGVMRNEPHHELEEIAVRLSAIEHVPEPGLVGDSIRLSSNRRPEGPACLLLRDFLAARTLVLWVRDARQHPHRLLHALRALDGELAGLGYESSLAAEAFELDEICPNLVFRCTEEPNIVDVPRIAAPFLQFEVDREQEALGEEVRRERSLR